MVKKKMVAVLCLTASMVVSAGLFCKLPVLRADILEKSSDGISDTIDDVVTINTTNFPDANFRNFIINYGYDADGFNYWLGLLNNGTSRTDAMKAFASCPEFQEICNQYGIDRGEIV